MNILKLATTDVITISPADSIDHAIELMDARMVHHLVVVDQTRHPLGLVSDRDILISTGWRFSIDRRTRDGCSGCHTVGPIRVEQIMSRPVVSLPEDATPRQAAIIMRDRRIGALPVVQEGELAGIVTVHDLMNTLDDLAADHSPAARFLEMPVRHRMSSPVLHVSPDSSLDEIVSLFQRFNIHHVPVTVENRLAGILSDRDVRRGIGGHCICEQQARTEAISPRVDPSGQVAQVMNREVMTIAPHAPLQQALRRMVFHRIHSLPVVQADKVIGIITPTDFVKAIAAEDLM